MTWGEKEGKNYDDGLNYSLSNCYVTIAVLTYQNSIGWKFVEQHRLNLPSRARDISKHLRGQTTEPRVVINLGEAASWILNDVDNQQGIQRHQHLYAQYITNISIKATYIPQGTGAWRKPRKRLWPLHWWQWLSPILRLWPCRPSRNQGQKCRSYHRVARLSPSSSQNREDGVDCQSPHGHG